MKDIVIEDESLKIIDGDTFERTQALLKERAQYSIKAKKIHSFQEVSSEEVICSC